jgi:hypothetical protein
MADDRIAFTSRASPQDGFGAARGPIDFDLVRWGTKWDKQNRSSSEFCPSGVDLPRSEPEAGLLPPEAKIQLEENTASRLPLFRGGDDSLAGHSRRNSEVIACRLAPRCRARPLSRYTSNSAIIGYVSKRVGAISPRRFQRRRKFLSEGSMAKCADFHYRSGVMEWVSSPGRRNYAGALTLPLEGRGSAPSAVCARCQAASRSRRSRATSALAVSRIASAWSHIA